MVMSNKKSDKAYYMGYTFIFLLLEIILVFIQILYNWGYIAKLNVGINTILIFLCFILGIVFLIRWFKASDK
jgi:hypothetical protein